MIANKNFVDRAYHALKQGILVAFMILSMVYGVYGIYGIFFLLLETTFSVASVGVLLICLSIALTGVHAGFRLISVIYHFDSTVKNPKRQPTMVDLILTGCVVILVIPAWIISAPLWNPILIVMLLLASVMGVWGVFSIIKYKIVQKDNPYMDDPLISSEKDLIQAEQSSVVGQQDVEQLSVVGQQDVEQLSVVGQQDVEQSVVKQKDVEQLSVKQQEVEQSSVVGQQDVEQSSVVGQQDVEQPSVKQQEVEQQKKNDAFIKSQALNRLGVLFEKSPTDDDPSLYLRLLIKTDKRWKVSKGQYQCEKFMMMREGIILQVRGPSGEMTYINNPSHVQKSDDQKKLLCTRGYCDVGGKIRQRKLSNPFEIPESMIERRESLEESNTSSLLMKR